MIELKSSRVRKAVTVAVASALAILLAACETVGPTTTVEPQQPVVEPEIPPTIQPSELVGRWGLASYQNPDDRARTVAAAKVQCKNPYVIGAGTDGGVIMHLADQAKPEELRVKGSRSGTNYIGPAGPPGDPQDREILSFDGNTLVTRFVDKDAGTRYGNMVYVRCGTSSARRHRSR